MIQKHISDYQTYLKDGESFMNRARKSVMKPDIYTPEIIYNITGMAIEKYIMGFLMYHNSLPYNHTFRDLSEALNTVIQPPAELTQKLEFLDSYQELCSLENFSRKEITKNEVDTILETGILVENFVKENLTLL
jgi:hypothetical protein